MLYIFHGEDDFSQREELARIKAELDSDGMLANNTTVLDGSQVRPDELAAICNTVPFLSEHRLVVVEGLLGRLETSRARRRRGRRGDSAGEALGPWRDLADALSHMPETTTLVLLDGRVSNKNPLLALLSPLGKAQAFAGLPLRAVPDWIERRARQVGLALAPGAARLLADLVGNNLWLISRELEKLGLYAGDRPIEEEDVRALVTSAREVGVFSMIDAVIEGRFEQAMRLVEQLLEQGATVPYLLTMVTRQYRHLLIAKELSLARLPPAEIGGRLRITSEFALKKVLEQAARYSIPQIEASYRRLLDADVAIKRGVYPDELALEMLLHDLSRLAARRRPASGPSRRVPARRG
jgi:DNA polymerase-3 subunit delta